MAVSFTAHAPDGTSRGTLAPSEADWQQQTGEDGSGRLTLAGDVPAAALAESTIIRVNDGTRDIFAFVPTSKTRRQVEPSTEVDLSGPGVRWLLHAGQVLQEDTSDCAEASGTRWLGWMSAAYDDSAWEPLVSFGTFSSSPWVTVRPQGWKDPDAEYVWTDEGAFAFGASPPGDCYFRWSFEVTEETDAVLMAAADDEFQLWLDGTEMMSTIDGGAFQWERFQSKGLRLCPGTHVVAVMGRNLARTLAAMNYGWVLWSIMPADSNGEPIATDQRYKVYHDHTGGTFTLTADGSTTAAIAWNASATDVRTALGAVVGGEANVTVDGSGTWESPWDISFVGALASSRVTLTGNPTGLTGGAGFEVDEWARGSSGEALGRSDMSGKVLPYPATAPGLTAGEVLRVVVEEVRARGATVLDDVTLDFSDPLDTDGVAWGEELTIPVSLPADVHRVAVILQEMGYSIDMTPSLDLQCWKDRGADLSADVELAPGTAGVTDVEADQDESTVANVVRFRSANGWHELVDAASVAARGRWESGLDLSGFASEREAGAVVGPLLADLLTPPRTTSLTVGDGSSAIPHEHFGMEDIITGPAFSDSGFEQTDMRVWAIGGRMAELSIDWTVELVD